MPPHYEHYQKKLPSYFYGPQVAHLKNPGGLVTEKALRDVNTRNTEFLEPQSCLNTNKNFRADAQAHAHKKSHGKPSKLSQA
jgi:hypothetical protein